MKKLVVGILFFIHRHQQLKQSRDVVACRLKRAEEFHHCVCAFLELLLLLVVACLHSQITGNNEKKEEENTNTNNAHVVCLSFDFELLFTECFTFRVLNRDLNFHVLQLISHNDDLVVCNSCFSR